MYTVERIPSFEPPPPSLVISSLSNIHVMVWMRASIQCPEEMHVDERHVDSKGFSSCQKSAPLLKGALIDIFHVYGGVGGAGCAEGSPCVSSPAPNRPGSGLTVNTREYWWVESELYLNVALFPLPVSWAAAGQVSVLFWPWRSADLPLLWMADTLISFLLLNLALVMKLGLLCFSHYLFIKDMTRKWGCHGDGSTKSPSCMPSCIVYSSAKSAVLNRKRKDFPAPSSLFLSSVVQTMTHK